MKKQTLLILVVATCIIVCPLIYAEEANSINGIDDIRQKINQTIESFTANLTDINSESAGVYGASAGSSAGCVEVDIEFPDTLSWEDGFNPGNGQGYFELTNCGDEAAEIWLAISISINITYIIDTTINFPPFPIGMGAGETIAHDFYFLVPPVEGNVTVCITAASGDAVDSDCASTAIIGLGTYGIPFNAQGVLFQGINCILFAPACDTEHGFVLENYGEFEIGDTVTVTGNLIWNCETACIDAIGCINDNTIEATDSPSIPFESCGFLVASQSCLLFIPASGNEGPYNPNDTLWQLILTLENYGEFQSGDSVFVAGTLIMENDPNCPQANGEVTENTIELCSDWPPTPFEACGILVQGVECVLFSPLADLSALYILDNYGTYEVNDTVFVDGYFIPNCPSYCMQGLGCIVDNLIDSCGSDPDPGVPYEACGMLEEINNCTLFTENGYYYMVLDNYGNYAAGDSVYVNGILYPQCYTACTVGDSSVGCLLNNTIGDCNPSDSTYYSGCGILMDDTGCIIFHPFDNEIPPAVLSDYGPFYFGDTVFVSGLVVPDCGDMCDYGHYVCLFNDTISYCNSDPTTPYAGCGVLIEELGGCILFNPLNDYYTHLLLDNYGHYAIGDTVYVDGFLSFGCPNQCGDSVVCLIENTIGECDSIPVDTVYYEGCGGLFEYAGCLLFYPNTGELPPMLLSDYGGYTAGDSVFIAGMVYLYCEPACGNLTIACMVNEVIEQCGEPGILIEGCGLLVQYDNCIAFLPLNSTYEHFILENYGMFEVGDTVFISGYYDGYTDACSSQTVPYITQNSIEFCDGGPPIPYQGCGILNEQNGCLIFNSFDDFIPPAILSFYGDFADGDTVFVLGLADLNCEPECGLPSIACIENDSIRFCDLNPGVPYEACGMFQEIGDCILFTENGYYYMVLDNYGNYSAGDSVYVNGTLYFECYTACTAGDSAVGCLVNNSIGDCHPPDTFYYEGCGILLDDSGCVRFHPFDQTIPPAVLSDYGTFNIFDSVFVSGLVDLDCELECAYGYYACIYNDSIMPCGSNPDPGEPYDACGVLITIEDCLLFHPIIPDTIWYFGFAHPGPHVLDNYGDYSEGDTVHVNGTLYYQCYTSCAGALGCVLNNTIGVCDSIPSDSIYFSGCGILLDDSGCIRFYPFDQTIPPAVLSNYGTFSVFDTVFVSGLVDPDCEIECAYGSYVCLYNDVIDTCSGDPDPGVPYEACGMLQEIGDCILFTEDGNYYMILDNYGNYSAGDSVYVNGTLYLACYTACTVGDSAVGCLLNNSIGDCHPPDTSYYEGCGVLVEGINCLMLIPLVPDTVYNFAFLLENYGDFGIGDTVFVTGQKVLIDPPPQCPSASIYVINNTIEICSQPFSGEPIKDKMEMFNSPNPFNPRTTINIYLPHETNVTLRIYNLLGQTVETLIDNEYMQGEHSVEWDGNRFASGIYFYRLDAGGKSLTKKMSLIK